jgi:multiple sugar transport system substrate-binding protein
MLNPTETPTRTRKPTRTPKPTKTPTPTPTDTPIPPPTDTPTPKPTETPEPAELRWFIGLGTGTNSSDQIRAEGRWVEDFNASQDEIELTIEILDTSVAYDALKAMLAAGDLPDIVGPVGTRGSGEFYGQWLDLENYLKGYDLSDFSQSAIDAWRVPGQGLIGLAIGISPSALYVNRELFDEAAIEYPPQDYTEGGDWTIQAMAEMAKTLTVDVNGYDAYSSRFDPDRIVQFGYCTQWSDARGMATLFGAGSFVADDGETAQCPDHWREAFHWYHRGMWEDYFMPSGPYYSGELLGGNPFNSGNVAMAHCHLWCTCCVDDVPDWDYVIVPSYNGTHTAKVHTDAICVLKGSRNPDAAVDLVYTIANAEELLDVWGNLPAAKRLQGDFLDGLDREFPQGVNWGTILAGSNYVDVPHHESWMPNLSQANNRISVFQSELERTADLDVDAAIDELVADLQEIFESA